MFRIALRERVARSKERTIEANLPLYHTLDKAGICMEKVGERHRTGEEQVGERHRIGGRFASSAPTSTNSIPRQSAHTWVYRRSDGLHDAAQAPQAPEKTQHPQRSHRLWANLSYSFINSVT